MSTSPPDPVPSTPPSASSAQKTKPVRSSAERVLVWGGIIVLLLLVGFQARARFGYEMTLNALQDRIAQDEGPNPQPLYVKDVDGLLVGWPQKEVDKASDHRAYIQLSWRGLTSRYGMTLPYDPSEPEPAIMGLETSDAPPEEEPVAVTPSESDAPASTPGMMPGMPGSPGGPAADDADPDAAGTPEATTEPEATAPEGTEPEATEPSSDTPEEPAADAGESSETDATESEPAGTETAP